MKTRAILHGPTQGILKPKEDKDGRQEAKEKEDQPIRKECLWGRLGFKLSLLISSL